MRRKRPHIGTVNYWPGYVDAMTNVVLNLLFMVAMFGITIAVFNRASRHDRTAPAGVKIGLPSVEQIFVPSPPPAAPQVLPPVAVSRPAPATNVPPPIAAAPSARPAPVRPRLALNLPTAETPPVEDVAIVVADAWQRRGGPDAIISRRIDPQGRLVMTFDVPSGADPVTVLGKPGVGEALRGALGGKTEKRVRLWTSTDRLDALARRASFLSLMTLRNTLIKNGYSTNSIDVHLFEGSAAVGGGQRVFLAVTP